jgi:hypothetical protein
MAAQKRWFVIHAGTHKTASSYIQSRMAANGAELERAGVLLRDPGRPAQKHKPLAAALAKRAWPEWIRYLRGLPPTGELVLVSGEHFTQPLANRRRHRALAELLEAEGFGLHVLLFLRDQPDYINARFVHSTRRLYHRQSFDAYVECQLVERRHIYDYNHLFSTLIDDSRIRCTFLPYGSSWGDPFDRLLTTLGHLPPEGGWRPAPPDKGNVQPGCGGVWLAQQIREQLDELGIEGRSLANARDPVRRIAEREGWQLDRYCGFDAPSAAAVATHYASANDAFAQHVWGCPWRQRMPELPMHRRVFEPPADGMERQRLEGLVRSALLDLASQNRHLARALRCSAPTMAVEVGSVP